jgi:hypothetical protein
MVLPVILAKQTCRCAECLGPLADATNGLVCAANFGHKGIIHKDEAAKIAQERASQLQQVKAAYTIKDGVIVALDDQIGDETL